MPDIVINAKGDYSKNLKSLSDSTKAFSKNLSGLQSHLDSLNRTKATLKVDLSKAKAELKEAQKQFAATGDEASRLAMVDKQFNLDQITDNLRAVTKAGREAEKQIEKTVDAGSRAQNRSGGSGGVVAQLGSAGLYKMVGDVVADVAVTGISSAYGDTAGTYASSIISGAASGAAIGSMIAPGIGTAIGAAVGTVTGTVSAGMKVFEKRDDAFKEYYKSAIESQDALMNERLASGGTIAGGREQTQIAFARALGSEEAAVDYLTRVERFATKTNYAYDEITSYAKMLMNTYAPDDVFGVLTTLSDASAGLNLDSSDVTSLINVLNTMKLTGTISSAQLKQFAVRGINIYEALAQGMGVSTNKVKTLVSKGKITGEAAAKAVLAYIDESFGGLSEKLAGTYDAMVDNLQDAQDSTNAAMGNAYNEERKKGIQAETSWLEGDYGNELREAYALIGEGRAIVENAKEEAMRAAMESMFNSDEYKTAMASHDYLTVERLLKEAGIQGQNDFNASTLGQDQLKSQKELITAVREDTASNEKYWDKTYALGLEIKGLMTPPPASSTYVTTSAGVVNGNDVPGAVGYAVGLSYVPHDNFPALLHQGERVLTAEQARAADDGAVAVQISGNTFVIREDADVDRVATALLEKLQLAARRG